MPRASLGIGDSTRLARRLGWLDPMQIGAMGLALARWGPTLAAVYAASATRHPNDTAIVDDSGSITFRELDRRSSLLASGLKSLDLDGSAHLGILCTNHAGFVEVVVAAAKADIPVVLLNTGFAGPQLGEVAEREGVRAVACDADLADVVLASGFDGPVIVADGEFGGLPSLDDIRDRSSKRRLMPSLPSVPVLLTSGTTGTPKGARREARAAGINSAVGLLQGVPYRTRDISVIPTPLFHAWGLAQLTIAATTGSTAVLVRRFTPEATLAAVEANHATVLAVVPIMLQRMLAATGKNATADDVRHLVAADRGHQRLRAPGHGCHRMDGSLRRQPLQHVRLHRSRPGNAGDTRRSAGCARHGRTCDRRQHGRRRRP